MGALVGSRGDRCRDRHSRLSDWEKVGRLHNTTDQSPGPSEEWCHEHDSNYEDCPANITTDHAFIDRDAFDHIKFDHAAACHYDDRWSSRLFLQSLDVERQAGRDCPGYGDRLIERAGGPGEDYQEIRDDNVNRLRLYQQQWR